MMDRDSFIEYCRAMTSRFYCARPDLVADLSAHDPELGKMVMEKMLIENKIRSYIKDRLEKK